MLQIGILEPLLSEFECRDTIDIILYNDASDKTSSSYCDAALRDLKALVNNLGTEISSLKGRKRAAARLNVVLKRETLAKFQVRLQRAVNLPQSSQLNYL